MEDNKEVALPAELTPKVGADILYQSFNLGQNDTDMQQYLFQLIHMDNPTWKISDELKEEIYQLALSKILKRVTPTQGKVVHPPQVEAWAKDQTHEQLFLMQRIFNGEHDHTEKVGLQNKPTLLLKVVQKVIDLDYYYLVLKGGRKNRLPHQVYFSYFKTHLIDGKSIGQGSIDKILSESQDVWFKEGYRHWWTVEHYENHDALPMPTEALQAIAFTWEKHHQGQSFFDEIEIEPELVAT